MTKLAMIFPGQGVQQPGMGKELFETFSEAREVFEEASDLLQRDLMKLMFTASQEEITKTSNSQVAIYVHSIAALRVLQSKIPELTPSFVAGHSLGEYSALTAAQALSFQDCLPLVQHRANFMREACEAKKGAMAALIGMSEEQVRELLEKLNRPTEVGVANYNSPGQVVVSGTPSAIEALIPLSQELGARKAIALEVQGAFHSALMEDAQEKLAPKIQEAPFKEPSCGLVMNVSAQLPKNPEEIKGNLIAQVTGSVRWMQSMQEMDRLGVEHLIEVGPGKVLSGLQKRMNCTAKSLNFGSPQDLTNIEQLVAKIRG